MEEAKKYCLFALRNQQNDSSIYVTLGLILNDSKQYEEALECYSIALELNQHDYAALVNSGTTLVTLKQIKEAVK